jgi:acylphosphatase
MSLVYVSNKDDGKKDKGYNQSANQPLVHERQILQFRLFIFCHIANFKTKKPTASQMAVKRIHAFLKGKVQGTGFREFTRREAGSLEVSGFVRNLKDGRVEIIAEGEEKKLKEFERRFKKGPLMAFVTDTELTEESPSGEFDGFDIHYS